MTHPFGILYRRCFYTSVQMFFTPNRPHHFGRVEAFHCLSFPYATVKLLLIAYLMYTGFPPYSKPYLQYDIWCSWFHLHSDQFDVFIPILIYLFSLCYHVVELLLFRINVQSPVWNWWYELVIVNLNDYEDCRFVGRRYEAVIRKKVKVYNAKLNSYRIGKIIIKNRMTTEWVFKKMAEFEAFWRMENIDQKQLLARPLLVMPYLSVANRKKLLVNMILFDDCAYAFQIAVVPILLTFMALTAFSYPNWTQHPLLAILLALLEAICISLGILRMFRLMIFFLGITIFAIIIFTAHVIEFQQMIKQQIGQCTKKRQLLAVRYRWFLHLALREHIKIFHLVECGNDELFSNVMYIFVLTMIPINIFIIRRLVFEQQAPLETLIMWLIGFFQLIILLGIFASLSWCCTVYHHPKKYIPQLLSLMRGPNWLMIKLKYDDLYGRLMHGPKIAISLGPINAVTYLTSVELLTTYVAYLLMAFDYEISG